MAWSFLGTPDVILPSGVALAITCARRRTDTPATGEAQLETRTVVLFDGVCNLCNGFVNFLIDRDPDARLAFAGLQSEAGRGLLRAADLPEGELQSVVVLESGRAYARSTAALRILLKLGLPWRALAALLLVVPRPLRDVVYDWVAKSRYRWFGRQDTCRIPTPELRARFLDPLPGDSPATGRP